MGRPDAFPCGRPILRRTHLPEVPALHTIPRPPLAALAFAGLCSFALPAAAEPIRLEGDLTAAPRRVFRARLAVPASPGPLRLHLARRDGTEDRLGALLAAKVGG